ncbi:MAG: elongation factor G [Candidatus Aureabacteria bacterium]|nr:elongation factor G [Candidatus Auribacterota bacterium]
MDNVNVSEVRNCIVVGHGTCGKTTLVDSLMHKSGANDRFGRVDNGSSLSDCSSEEKERKISIFSAPLHLMWKNHSMFITDTPGYADFFGEAVGAMKVSDSAIVVIDASSGVGVGTHRTWDEADKYGIGRVIFVTRLDKEEHSDFLKTYNELVSEFGKKCVPVTLPIGKENEIRDVANIITGEKVGQLEEPFKALVSKYKEALMEAVAESDDALLEKYFDKGELSDEELKSGLKNAIIKGTVVPVLAGSGDREIGSQELLDFIADYMPSPVDVRPLEIDGKEIKADKKEPLVSFVFKAVTDPYVGQLTYLRIYSGVLRADSEAVNVTIGSKERIGHIYTIKGKEQIAVSEAGPGDIVAVAKLKNTHVNNTLCGSGTKISVTPIEFPKPLISFAVYPKAKDDEEKIGIGFHRIAEEDPTIKVERNSDTKELVISGMGALHIEAAMHRVKTKFHVDADLLVPKVAYKETIKKKSDGHEKYKKQSGGKGQYGEVYLKIEPLERGAGFEFVNEIVGGAIPRNFLPAVEKGIKESMIGGIVAGYPVVDTKARCYDGSYHDVDSSEMAFKIAGSKAFKDAFMKAKPILLEPIMNIEVVIPSDYMGDITGDLNSKRGRISGMEPKGSRQKVKAMVPQAEVFRYSTELRSMTGGRGTFTVEFSHYEEVPAHIAPKIIEEAKKQKEK